MKSTLLILSLFLSVAANAQKENLNESRWHSGDNNRISDYKNVKKSGISYFLSNDNENIYLDLRIEGTEVQNVIIRQGMVLWIDMEGKLRKKLGVRFPVGSQKQLSHSKASQLELTTNPDGSPKTPLSMANTIELIGFTGEQERHFPSENADNFSATLKYDNDGVLCYKMRMPLAKLPVRNTKEGNGALPFTLGLEYGFAAETNKPGPSMNQASSSDNQSAGSRGGGRSGGGRSGRGGRMSIGSIGNNPETHNTEAGSELLWIKDIKLAASK
jgi:hypothetical protein